MIHIRGGTSNFSENLCATCRYALKRIDHNGRQVVRCNALAVFVTTRTIECSHYLHYSQMDLYEMKQASWILKTTGRNTIGFVPFVDLEQNEKEKVIL